MKGIYKSIFMCVCILIKAMDVYYDILFLSIIQNDL
jgi:hypothetical protein